MVKKRAMVCRKVPKKTIEKLETASSAPISPPSSNRERLSALIVSLGVQIEASGAPKSGCSWADRANLARAMTTALRQQARLDGEGELSEQMIARSAPYRRMVAVIWETLKPWPAAMKALTVALRKAEMAS